MSPRAILFTTKETHGEAAAIPGTDAVTVQTTMFADAAQRTDAGVWECEPCEWNRMDMGQRAEFFYVTEGAIVLREPDGTELVASAGTAVYSPPGWVGQWRVPQRLTKVFVSFYPPIGGNWG